MMPGVDTAIRVSVIVLIALGGTLMFRGRSAAVRHWVLALGIACAAAAPLLQILLPAWRVDVAVFPSAAPVQAQRSPVTATIVFQKPQDQLGAAVGAAETARDPIHVSAVLAIVWLVGAAVSVSALLVGLKRLSRLASAAQRIEGGRWVGLAAEIRDAIGLRRPIALLQSDHPTLLVTWGLTEPKIILPAGAGDWPDDRVRIVLQHELAHVRRGDWPAQMIAEILRAAYWFNPLLWIASRRLREESERACDDTVLNSGIDPADYASHLVDLARIVNGTPRSPGPALAMARSSSLEGRVSAMLNARLNRRPLTRVTRFATAAILVALAIPIAVASQSRFSTFAGTVVDQTNRFVPATTLTLTNVSTDAKYEVHADRAGRFEFVGLPSGDYRLRAAQPGFAAFADAITIAGDLNRTITLQIGSVRETVTTNAIATTVPDPNRAQQPEVRERVEAGRRRAAEKCAGGVAGELGGNVLPPMKLFDVRVAYPEQMKASGTAGVVTLDALIATDGTVRDLKAMTSPNPEFEQAAIDAVRQWEFTPTYLNCTPIEVRMQVTVNFVAKP